MYLIQPTAPAAAGDWAAPAIAAVASQVARSESGGSVVPKAERKPTSYIQGTSNIQGFYVLKSL